ncbi:hypothetical protein DPX16_12548 [Anabarilius grahami]|uniref:Uncharacterized protein n=1 Tax=Anabarilius grahami TaxID=495550 RepID=A0A3N0YK64_ANAGA|nr:hypothetical protein DPX16_12548 [Anabarilius grahami]
MSDSPQVTHNLQLLLLSPDKNIACGACGVWKVTGARSRASLTRNVMAVAARVSPAGGKARSAVGVTARCPQDGATSILCASVAAGSGGGSDVDRCIGIADSEDDDDSELPPSGVVAQSEADSELAAMLAWVRGAAPSRIPP